MKKQKIKYGQHRAMILSPWDWPCYPALPLKRPVEGQNWPQLAVIFASTECMTALDGDRADPSKPFTVFLGNLHEKTLLEDRPFITYDNIDQLLLDGWQVD